jgi:hypothetical protein
MRDYSKVGPKFWIGETGKALRGHPEAQIVAMYLMTCPNSEMTGVFYCPMWAIAAETGLGEEGASKGLQRLVEVDFCTYEAGKELVFVHEMAKYQIGEELKVNDNQVKSVQKAFSSMKGVIRQRFFEKYEGAFHLVDSSPSQAPSKPRTETGAGTETTSVPNGTGAVAPPEGLTAQDSLFQVAVPWLVAAGAKESNVRSLLGGAVKQLGADGAWDLASQCMREKPIEPIAWLAGAVNSRIKARASPGGGKVPQKENFDEVDYGQSGRL